MKLQPEAIEVITKNYLEMMKVAHPDVDWEITEDWESNKVLGFTHDGVTITRPFQSSCTRFDYDLSEAVDEYRELSTEAICTLDSVNKYLRCIQSDDKPSEDKESALSFEEFQLSIKNGIDVETEQPCFVYAGGCIIGITSQEGIDEGFAKYHLGICTEEWYDDDLAVLEKKLYDEWYIPECT